MLSHGQLDIGPPFSKVEPGPIFAFRASASRALSVQVERAQGSGVTALRQVFRGSKELVASIVVGVLDRDGMRWIGHNTFSPMNLSYYVALSRFLCVFFKIALDSTRAGAYGAQP